MEPIYVQNFTMEDMFVDRYGFLKPSMLLYMVQEVGGHHSELLQVDYDTLNSRNLFWAVTRHRGQVTRWPVRGETIRVETWPLPATRAAYPRSVSAYDAHGNEVFRCMTLWVLMDLNTRRMITPGKSGIIVAGTHREGELPAPTGLIPCPMGTRVSRKVSYSDLDRNGHMNNTRCMDWIADLLPSAFHEGHTITDFTVCYLAEAQEGQTLTLNWTLTSDGSFQADATTEGEDAHRVFSARLFLESK